MFSKHNIQNQQSLHIRVVTCSIEELDSANDLFKLIDCFSGNGLVARVPVTYVFQLIAAVSPIPSIKLKIIV